MLATHTVDSEDPASGAGQSLYTISAGGFSATVDAFARDEGDRRPLVRLDGGKPDRAQGDLGLPPQAAPPKRPTSSRARTAWPSRADTGAASSLTRR